MTTRFFKRIRLFPGVTLNLTKRGISFSFGIRGAKITAGRTGIRRTFGIPGTGLFHTKHYSNKKNIKGESVVNVNVKSNYSTVNWLLPEFFKHLIRNSFSKQVSFTKTFIPLALIIATSYHIYLNINNIELMRSYIRIVLFLLFVPFVLGMINPRIVKQNKRANVVEVLFVYSSTLVFLLIGSTYLE